MLKNLFSNIHFDASDFLFASAALFALIGTLLIMYAEKKTVKTITETPLDIIGPLLVKDYIIDPRLIAKRKFYDPNNIKMKRLKIIGIILLIFAPLLTIIALVIT